MDIQSNWESLFNRPFIRIILKRTMLLSTTLLVVLSNVRQSLQQGIITQMSSASYKKIEVEYDSWMTASLNEANIFLPDSTQGYAAFSSLIHISLRLSRLQRYRGGNNGWYVVGRMLQASWGRRGKQQQEQNSPNHVPTIISPSVFLLATEGFQITLCIVLRR